MTNKFKTVTNFGDTTFSNKLELNLKAWLDWAFLQIGAWRDVDISETDVYAGDLSVLRMVDDANYTAGTLWEARRKDWVWETNIDYSDGSSTFNPVSPATFEVDSVVTAAASINYPLGRVEFPSAISSSSVVKANYSYRYIQVYIADNIPWWQELQFRSLRSDNTQFSLDDTGAWSVGGNHRIQMPCVILEAVPRSDRRGYQLGDGSFWVNQDILCHVLAESRFDRNQIVDILLNQFDNTFWMFDDGLVAEAGAFPLDENGDIEDSSKIYSALVDENTGYRWKKCRIIRTQSAEVEALSSRLYQGVVRLTCETVLND